MIGRWDVVLFRGFMDQKKCEQIVEKLHLNKLKRHIFLCADQTEAKCCSLDVGLQVWEHLKKRLDELGLSKQGGVFRTKANCLRVCMYGPIMVVYPDGVWYHSVTIPVLERILLEHIINGQPVQEFVMARHRLDDGVMGDTKFLTKDIG